jgi:hypothetical protein
MSAAVNQSPELSGVSDISGKLPANNRPIYSMLVFPKVRPGPCRSAPVISGQERTR